jgi:hypothetical protein
VTLYFFYHEQLNVCKKKIADFFLKFTVMIIMKRGRNTDFFPSLQFTLMIIIKKVQNTLLLFSMLVLHVSAIAMAIFENNLFIFYVLKIT